MPTYIYTDRKHEQTVVHGMNESPDVFCPICLARMHRKPQVARINWNGLPPHMDTRRSPEIENWLSNVERDRENYLATKDENPFNEFATKKAGINA